MKFFFVSFNVIVKNDVRVKRIVRVQINVIIFVHLCFVISIKFREFKLLNCNMLFNLNYIKRFNKKNEIFVHLINFNFFFVQIKNIID